MFSMHVSNPFTASSRREARDQKIMDNHHRDRETRDATRRAAWESSARQDGTNRAMQGASGGGMVKIRATAKGRILGVDIDESLLAPSEKSMLEDLVAAAINDARGKADAAAASEMEKMQTSLPLPPGFKLPF